MKSSTSGDVMPPRPRKAAKKRTGFRLPHDLMDETMRNAYSNGWTLTEVLEWGMAEYNRLYGPKGKRDA